VECDEYTIGRMAAQHLLGQEHKHFSCFRYSRNIHAIRRMAGFQDALKEAGYDCTDLEILSEHGSRAGEWFRKRLSRLSKPHGLFAGRMISSPRERLKRPLMRVGGFPKISPWSVVATLT